MKKYLRWVWFSSLVVALAVPCLGAEEEATVKAGRINARGQPSLTGEVITQLQQGDKVMVLDEVPAKNPKPGEPAKWLKIALPANTPVWVFAPFIDTNKTVNVKQLNVRGGPGENHAVLGRLERGTAVKEIRTVDSWMEIEAPAGTFVYVASDLLDRPSSLAAAGGAGAGTSSKPAGSTNVVVASSPVPPPPPTTVETVSTEPPPAVATEVQPGTPSTSQPAPPPVRVSQTPPRTVPMTEIKPAEVVTPAPGPRIVTREGRVVIAFSIQSPTYFGLESIDTRRLIYFLHSEDAAIELKKYAGRRVIVTGEEFLDQRWKLTPILDVQEILVVP